MTYKEKRDLYNKKFLSILEDCFDKVYSLKQENHNYQGVKAILDRVYFKNEKFFTVVKRELSNNSSNDFKVKIDSLAFTLFYYLVKKIDNEGNHNPANNILAYPITIYLLNWTLENIAKDVFNED